MLLQPQTLAALASLWLARPSTGQSLQGVRTGQPLRMRSATTLCCFFRHLINGACHQLFVFITLGFSRQPLSCRRVGLHFPRCWRNSRRRGHPRLSPASAGARQPCKPPGASPSVGVASTLGSSRSCHPRRRSDNAEPKFLLSGFLTAPVLTRTAPSAICGGWTRTLYDAVRHTGTGTFTWTSEVLNQRVPPAREPRYMWRCPTGTAEHVSFVRTF